MENVFYLVNFYHGELNIAVGEKELEQIKLSKDSWEVIDKDRYFQFKTMYDAGASHMRAKVLSVL